MELPLLSLDPRLIEVPEQNIRKTPNPAQHEIYTSLKASGPSGVVLEVSRPSIDSPWYVTNGGGSRLRALQKLAQQNDSHDSPNPFLQVRCIEVDWQDDAAHALAGLRENLARGDTSYAENCAAIQAVWDGLSDSGREPKSDQEFVSFLNSTGIKVALTSYRRMKFCSAKLLPNAPTWMYQGRAIPEYVRQIIDHRTLASKALSHPPEWLDLPVTYSSKEAKALYDNHLVEMCQSMDKEELDHRQLIRAVFNRLSKGCGVDPINLRLAMENKTPTKKENPTNPVLQQLNEKIAVSPDQIAQGMGMPDSFIGGLRFICELPAKDIKELQELLSSTLFKDDTNESTNTQSATS